MIKKYEMKLRQEIMNNTHKLNEAVNKLNQSIALLNYIDNHDDLQSAFWFTDYQEELYNEIKRAKYEEEKKK